MRRENITAKAWSDECGNDTIVIEKRRGRLTLDEVQEAVREHIFDRGGAASENGVYAWLFGVRQDTEIGSPFEEEPKGDRVEIFLTDWILKEGVRFSL